MDMEHEKIPFIDARDSVDMSLRSSSRQEHQNNPQILLELGHPNSSAMEGEADSTRPGQRSFEDSSLQPQSCSMFPGEKYGTIIGGDSNSDAADGSAKSTANEQSDVNAGNGDNTAENETQKRTNSFKFPLHRAAEKGNVKVLERLLVKGDPLTTDFKQKTPLHYACGFAYQKKAMKMLTAILASPQAQNTPDDHLRKKKLIDYQDKNGETGLHIAARTGHRMVVEELLFAAADVNLRDKNDIEPLEVIYSKVPAAMIPVFDGAVECKIGDPNDQNLTIRLDFGAIVGYPEIEKDITVFQMETKLLSYCLQQSEQKRAAILLHPIVQVFLHLKWKKIRILLWISILYHVIWLLLYTLFITDLYLRQCPYRGRNAEENDTDHHEWIWSNESDSNITSFNSHEIEEENKTDAPNITHNIGTTCDIGKDLLSSLNIKLTLLFVVSISVAIKELYEIYSTPLLKFYFWQLENAGQWILIGVVGLTSIPVFMRDNDNRIVIQPWQYQASALGIFLAWSLILSQIGKIPRFGVYIEILGKVLKSFVMFMITFASLLVAFTVAFQILLPEKVEFQSFHWGFMKVMIMMVGEINYDEVFYSEEGSDEIPFPGSTKLLYGAFVSIVTIILFNLLIGLTVSDTQGLQKIAQLTSSSSQLDQIYLMEKFIISKNIQRWLKMFKKNHWLRYFLVTQQTYDLETNMGVDIHISKIPKDLQHSVREVAVPDARQDKDVDDDGEYFEDDKASKQDNTEEKDSAVQNTPGKSTSTDSIDKAAKNDLLKEQIRDVLRELLEELKVANRNNGQL